MCSCGACHLWGLQTEQPFMLALLVPPMTCCCLQVSPDTYLNTEPFMDEIVKRLEAKLAEAKL